MGFISAPMGGFKPKIALLVMLATLAVIMLVFLAACWIRAH
jgi:hypothetical protein